MLAPEDYVSTPNENIGNRFATMPIVEPKKEVLSQTIQSDTTDLEDAIKKQKDFINRKTANC